MTKQITTTVTKPAPAVLVPLRDQLDAWQQERAANYLSVQVLDVLSGKMGG